MFPETRDFSHGVVHKVGIDPFNDKPIIDLPRKWIPFNYMYLYKKECDY